MNTNNRDTDLKISLSPQNVLDLISQLGLKFKGPDFGKFEPQTAWEWLVFCILSLRTRDEVSRATYNKLCAHNVKTIHQMHETSLEDLTKLIHACGFYKRKAMQLKKLAGDILSRYDGEIPQNKEELLSLPGIGLKTANFVLSRAFNIPAICVDIHVHRISNRLGWVQTKDPEETEKKLNQFVPQSLWILINDTIVPFGQHICLPIKPRCEQCPLDKICPKIIFINV